VELLKQGAVVTGRKKDLAERSVMCSIIMQNSSVSNLVLIEYWIQTGLQCKFQHTPSVQHSAWPV